MMEKLAQFHIRLCLVAGGLSIKAQEAALRTRPDVVVATPGRMVDHLRNSQSVGLEDLAILILDEAEPAPGDGVPGGSERAGEGLGLGPWALGRMECSACQAQ